MLPPSKALILGQAFVYHLSLFWFFWFSHYFPFFMTCLSKNQPSVPLPRLTSKRFLTKRLFRQIVAGQTVLSTSRAIPFSCLCLHRVCPRATSPFGNLIISFLLHFCWVTCFICPLLLVLRLMALLLLCCQGCFAGENNWGHRAGEWSRVNWWDYDALFEKTQTLKDAKDDL